MAGGGWRRRSEGRVGLLSSSPTESSQRLSDPLSITYLLADTTLFGGVKVVLRQAELMARWGHRVTVASPGSFPDWTGLDVNFVQAADLSASHLPEADVTVATYWTTIEPALLGGNGAIVHYCQGFETDHDHNIAEHPAILAAYGSPLPAMVVSSHLGAVLAKKFGRPWRLAPPLLESYFRPDERETPSSPPRILLLSPFEITWKGVATGVEAVAQLRRQGFDCRLIRLSQWPLRDEERRIAEPDEFHHRLSPEDVATLMRGCDLLLAPSHEAEGFGLFVLEAMGSGVPVVASDIACFRGYATDAVELVPHDQPQAFVDAARSLLGNPAGWRQARARGLTIAARDFGPARVGALVDEALRWVASGRWQEEP